jgi:hypothetical protein
VSAERAEDGRHGRRAPGRIDQFDGRVEPIRGSIPARARPQLDTGAGGAARFYRPPQRRIDPWSHAGTADLAARRATRDTAIGAQAARLVPGPKAVAMYDAATAPRLDRGGNERQSRPRRPTAAAAGTRTSTATHLVQPVRPVAPIMRLSRGRRRGRHAATCSRKRSRHTSLPHRPRRR